MLLEWLQLALNHVCSADAWPHKHLTCSSAAAVGCFQPPAAESGDHWEHQAASCWSEAAAAAVGLAAQTAAQAQQAARHDPVSDHNCTHPNIVPAPNDTPNSPSALCVATRLRHLSIPPYPLDPVTSHEPPSMTNVPPPVCKLPPVLRVLLPGPGPQPALGPPQGAVCHHSRPGGGGRGREKRGGRGSGHMHGQEGREGVSAQPSMAQHYA